jgi:hypothetical protein
MVNPLDTSGTPLDYGEQEPDWGFWPAMITVIIVVLVIVL